MERFNKHKGRNKPGDSEPGNRERYKNKRVENDKDEKTVKNPESLKVEKNVDNEDLFAGLALQRQWDDKPDIDHLSNSLLQLYHKMAFENNHNCMDLLDKIFLTSLRVKAKTVSFNNFNKYKLKSLIKSSYKVLSKYKNVKHNIPKIEQYYLNLCKRYQQQRDYCETYDKLSKIVNKLPNVKQLNYSSSEYVEKRNANIDNFNKLLQVYKSKITHLGEIYNLLTQ